MIKDVTFSRFAQNQLNKLPRYIVSKLKTWVEAVREDGLEKVRKTPGYHDEPLKGKRFGQRSIRLSQSYRAIYMICSNDEIEFVSIEEVNKHDY